MEPRRKGEEEQRHRSGRRRRSTSLSRRRPQAGVAAMSSRMTRPWCRGGGRHVTKYDDADEPELQRHDATRENADLAALHLYVAAEQENADHEQRPKER